MKVFMWYFNGDNGLIYGHLNFIIRASRHCRTQFSYFDSVASEKTAGLFLKIIRFYLSINLFVLVYFFCKQLKV